MTVLTEEQKAWLRRHHEDGQAILSAFEAMEEKGLEWLKAIQLSEARAAEWEARCDRMADAEQRASARVALLQEFFEAFEVVEAGIVDFDLHNDAVMRLRAAREALYRSGAAGPTNAASHSALPTIDTAAPEKPWGPDHPSYDEMGQ